MMKDERVKYVNKQEWGLYLQMKLGQRCEAGKKASVYGLEVIIIQPQSPQLWHTPKGRRVN